MNSIWISKTNPSTYATSYTHISNIGADNVIYKDFEYSSTITNLEINRLLIF